MAVKKKNTPKKTHEKPPPLDQWIKPAVGIALALLGYQFFKGMVQQEIHRVNLDDELELREVLFGEIVETEDKKIPQNYAVLCHPETATYPISSVFQDAHKEASSVATFRVMDCDTVMAGSEKTAKERFKLNDKTRPLVFVSGKQGPPKQVPAKHLKTGSMLAKALKNLLTPKAEKIETTQDLRSKCLDKDICGLLLKGAKTSPNYVKDAIEKLVVEYPKVAFGAVDTSVLYVKGLEAEYMPEFQPGTPRFVVFQKVAGSADKSKNDSSRLKTSLIPLEGGLGYGPMSNLVASVVSKKADMQKVSTLPTIKTRTKKLEEEERAKRQRRQDQQQRGQDKDSGGTPGGYFTDNDGSAEGRKAERERRRAEHRKSNPNFKEKTPEEIAEMERKRRARMEEEAAKWNMAPDDAPDEGEQVDGGNDGSYSMDWDDEDTDGANGDQNDDEDDEDVLDLD